MQNSGWKQERLAIIVFIILASITGAVSGLWSWSFLLWLVIYFAWKISEFKSFYDWYMRGASKKNLPAYHGIFETISCKVISNKNRIKEAQNRNKHLLQQFVTTAQALPFATLLLNSRFEIQWVNLMAQEILNISDADMNGKIDNIIREPAFIELLSTGIEDQEIKLNLNSDNSKSIQLRLIQINKDRFLMVAWDISAQEALQKSRKAFVANASHELRTPLTVISGYLEMMQSSDHVNEDWSVAIDQAKDQATRMAKIIDDMLKLSKIEHNRAIQSKNDEIPMPELINGLFNDIKNGPNSGKHIMEAEINSALWLKGDSSEITSICLNLIHNATIHTPDGTRIKIKWFIQNEEAHFYVIDNGPGIDAKHIPHLTERFYRVDNSKVQNQQSTGLGLAIVKHICIKHGARFEVESTQGQGTTFKVIFPAHRSKIVR
ncbi:phosphate regulon sensor histidine kinase PhoR [Marinicella litoralis]|uniref:histidine kinase n=1 Tax=Marinicella litoralis TaxID=644220 RepID=A0A4V3DIX6_9GAMM|nr:phosphate regulon sensor histidine kinase PhoR [Marinicella litoralis]TDR23541.1 PAS/PAC sensor signal transduction histidine kinase [Marinicella litoralis]